MSKAVTNEQVEDVLSSIRRLVSEDKRPLAGLRSATAQDANNAKREPEEVPSSDGDRLVLTPALRVEPVKLKEVLSEDSPLDLGSVARQTWTNDDSDAEVSAPEIKEAVSVDNKVPMQLFPVSKPEESDEAMDALDALVHSTLESETLSVEEVLDEDAYTAEEYWDLDDVDDEKSDTSSVQSGDDEETVDDKQSEEVSQFNDEGDRDVHEAGADQALEDDDSGAAVEAIRDDIDTLVLGSERDSGFESEETKATPEMPKAAVHLTAKIAALEAAFSGARQDWDGDEVDELASPDAPTMIWEDDVELDATGAPVVHVPEDDAETESVDPAPAQETAAAASAFGGDDQLMDEDALRDLVSEIVRAELQGALGERITRNVRKLVRREIHRALTAQELE